MPATNDLCPRHDSLTDDAEPNAEPPDTFSAVLESHRQPMIRLNNQDFLVVLRLLRSKGAGMRTLARVLRHCLTEGERPASLAELSCQELRSRLGLLEPSARAFLSDADGAREIWNEMEERNVRMLLRGWPDYPEHLGQARGEDAPAVVFATGNLDLLRRGAVGFCGSRKASERGLEITEECARSVAGHGLNVVSGYAHGVDLAAHRGALAAGGTTTLVLAEGILHFRLKRDIKSVVNESNFVAMSEFPPSLPWSGRNAMARNHTICGLSQAMILVESGAEGGTFECGKAALDQHCPLFVVDYAQRPDSAEGNAFFLERGARALRRSRSGRANLQPVIDEVRRVDAAPKNDKTGVARQAPLLCEGGAVEGARPPKTFPAPTGPDSTAQRSPGMSQNEKAKPQRGDTPELDTDDADLLH